MIELLFFDVGETLIHGNRAFVGVHAALEAIAGFETAEGRPLVLGIVSDYHLPAPPPTEAKILALEQRYRDEVLGPAGLSRFFEPFDRRVALSSRAGVFKPDRAVFDLALARSQTGATLAQCAFVTENAAHLQACQAFGMTPVRFGTDAGASFGDWIDAPAVLAALVAPGGSENLARAAATQLAARHGLVGFRPTKGARGVQGHAKRLVQLHDAKLGVLDGVHVELPATVTAAVGPDGRLQDVVATEPDDETVADALNFVTGLVQSLRVATPGQATPPDATHVARRDEAGRLRLARVGYSDG